MPKLTREERIRLIELFHQRGQSPTAALRAYGQETGNYKVCSPKTLRTLVARFHRTGSVADAPRNGRPKTSEDTIMEIAMTTNAIAEQNGYGQCSIRDVAKMTGVHPTTVWRALRNNLDQYPYRIQILHELKEGDPQQRLAFAQRFWLKWQSIQPGWTILEPLTKQIFTYAGK